MITFNEYIIKSDKLDEREMSNSQKLKQIQYYWDDLNRFAPEETKKQKLKLKFDIDDIKLDKHDKIISFKFRGKTVSEKRDYKDEYKKFQSSTKSKKYRAELNKYNRDRGTYGNGDGKDASHKNGKIVGMEDAHINRGRAEKSRLVGSKRKK
jgi:hypothetical protein